MGGPLSKNSTRLLSVLLVFAMLLGLFATPASAETRESAITGDVDGDGVVLPRDAAIVARYLARWEDYVDENGELTYPETETAAFSVGYGKVNITPDPAYYPRVPLAGYGNTNSRLASGVPDGDGLYLTCVAIRDERGETVLMFTVDRSGFSGFRSNESGAMVAEGIKNTASQATGIPAENMAINASHTHSGPEYPTSLTNSPEGWGYMTRYIMEVFQKGAQAARRAIADLTPATLWAGDTSVTDLNFVRRRLTWYSDSKTMGSYQSHSVAGETEQTMHRIGYEGPNPVDDGDIAYENETPADNEVQYIVFKREGVKDVLLYNWQCHADITGNDCPDLSLDGSYRAFGKAANDSEGTSSYTESEYKNTNTAIRAKNRIITADYINGVRRVLDEKEGYLTAFFNGGSGNNNYYDIVGYSNNAQTAKAEYAEYRLPGWDSRYYTLSDDFSSSTGRKGYWKSQMIGAIVADSILKDMNKPYAAYSEPHHNDVTSTQNRTYKDSENVTKPVITHHWTDNWQGLRQLETGNVSAMHSTFYSTLDNADRDLATVMAYLSDLAAYDRVGVTSTGADIPLMNTYSVTYTGTTVSVTAAEINEIRDKAVQFAALSTIAERKTFARDMLRTYIQPVRDAFKDGIYANQGQNGNSNALFKKARLVCRLATGLYVSNYSGNGILDTRLPQTDLTQETTDLSLHTRPIPLSCIAIGQSVAFSFMPYEMFDTLGQMIKDGRYIRYDENDIPITETRTALKPPRLTASSYTNVNGKSSPYPTLTYEAALYEYRDEKSPFELTFACGYSNGSYGYMPTLYARNHQESDNYQNGYETYITKFLAGTGEDHAMELITMLNILYNGGDTTPRVSGNPGGGMGDVSEDAGDD